MELLLSRLSPGKGQGGRWLLPFSMMSISQNTIAFWQERMKEESSYSRCMQLTDHSEATCNCPTGYGTIAHSNLHPNTSARIVTFSHHQAYSSHNSPDPLPEKECCAFAFQASPCSKASSLSRMRCSKQ